MPKAAADKKKSKARKTSSNPTRVFTLTAYGRLSAEQREALVPEFKLIEDQLFQAFLYRRTLVQVENRRRSRYHRLLLMISPLLRQHEERLQEIDEIIRKSRGFLKEKKKRTEEKWQKRKTLAYKKLMSMAGMFSDAPDVGTNHDKYLGMALYREMARTKK